ncbi:hypothetical protein B5G10_04175 [Barnesiella sp. An55]|nr:hypothetical protein B5G10_04175 [Barnesiella sp. An55]
MILAALGVLVSSAQEKIKVSDGLYIVSYGNVAVIEDDVNQRSISITISQDGIDKSRREKMYKVVCGKWTKRVVKDGLKAAIAAGIAASASSVGTSLIASGVATLASYIYDDVCEYYGSNL